MAYYSTHGISQFLLNNEKQRVRFLLAHPVQSSNIFHHRLATPFQFVCTKPYHIISYLDKAATAEADQLLTYEI